VVGPSKQASKQASKHTHAECNEITLVWGSLRLAPIRYCTMSDWTDRVILEVKNVLLMADLECTVAT